MKSRINKSLLYAVVLLLLGACNKQNIVTDNNTSVHAKLSLFMVHDTTHIFLTGYSPDTMELYRFSYDAQGRTSSIYHRGIHGGPGPIFNGTRLIFLYQGNDTLPYYCKSTPEYGGGYQEFYVYYDADGYVKRDSSIIADINGPYDYSARDYALQGSNLIFTYRAYPTSNPNGTPSVLVRNFDLQFNNGNIVSQKENLPDVKSVYENTFDTKPNPLFEAWPYHFRVPFFTLTLPPYCGCVEADFLVQQPAYKNNQLKQVKTFTATSNGDVATATREYSYTYDADGYPLIIKQSTPGIPITIDDMRRYEYKFVYQ